jgi:thiamine pyridinylase
MLGEQAKQVLLFVKRRKNYCTLIAAPALAFVLCSAMPMPRVLHLSMYPYIPEAADAALNLKQGFEDSHPGVLLRITFNANYYDPAPDAHGVLNEDADVHEIDAIFLRDFIEAHKLSPFSPGFAASVGRLVPLADAAARADGEMVAIPHWLCSDFLFYRANRSGLNSVHSLAGVEAGLHTQIPGHGLLLDMAHDALGELVLSLRLGERGDTTQAVAHLGDPPDKALIQTLQHILMLEPPSFGRSDDYDARAGFYARQFARHAGSAFIGYSEATHDMLDETATSCRHEDHCLTASDIRIGAWPFSGASGRQNVWVDMYGIDARVHGALHADAEDFIRFAMRAETFRALLVPQSGGVPRYLLPARDDVYRDPAVLQAAPLYPQFRAIIDHGVVVSAPHLEAKLRAAAAAANAALPASH